MLESKLLDRTLEYSSCLTQYVLFIAPLAWFFALFLSCCVAETDLMLSCSLGWPGARRAVSSSML